MEHGPWSTVTVRLDGRARVVRCDACGITVTRIGVEYPVLSQPECRLAPAGADGSTTP